MESGIASGSIFTVFYLGWLVGKVCTGCGAALVEVGGATGEAVGTGCGVALVEVGTGAAVGKVGVVAAGVATRPSQPALSTVVITKKLATALQVTLSKVPSAVFLLLPI
jgi:hypothetical protein